MAEQAVKFARLLTEAIYRIRARESKAIRVVEDELGYTLGKKGGASIEHWRKGNIPSKLSDIELLARELVRRTDLDANWFEELLRSAGHPQAAAFVKEMRLPEIGPTAVNMTAVGASTAIPAFGDPALPLSAPATPEVTGNLPSPPTPFIGRSQELAAISERLQVSSCRLLTLVGLGGMGKTRLAIQAALLTQPHFPHGVYFVSLAALASGDLLLSTVANAINLSFYSGSAAKIQLLSYLRQKKMLLILDNFEHLIEEVTLVGEIMENAPAVKLLITSRERLNLRGEWVFDVEGLSFPAKPGGQINGVSLTAELEAYGAVNLFVQSAQRVRADFSLSTNEIPYVIRICQLVEGIPLGIELAAAWVKLLSCEEIAREIEQNYNFLATTWRGVPQRHRSLQAVFDYSWNLLTNAERLVMSKLSVFSGGFTREAATAVGDASLLTLSALVDKSLLHRAVTTEGAGGKSEKARYDMHELLRRYSDEKLVTAAETRNLHCRYYVEFLKRKWSHLRGGRQRETLEEIGEEIENVRAAWRWAVSQAQEAELAQSLNTLFYFYDIRGWVQEGEEAFATAVARLQETVAPSNLILARLMARQGRFNHRLGFYPKAQQLLSQALAVFRAYDAQEEIAFALNYLGNIAYRLGDYATAREICQESIVICRRNDYRWEIVTAVETLANVAEELGEYHEARRLCQEGLETCLAIGDRRGVAACLNGSGYLQWRLGDPEAAHRLCSEGLAIYREIGDRRGTAVAIKNLGNVASEVQDYVLAEQYYQESLAICREIGYQWGIAAALNNLGSIAWESQDYYNARLYSNQSLEIWRRLGDQWGSAGSLETLGTVALGLGEFDQALFHFREALRIALNIKAVPLILQVLTGFANLLARQGQKERALQLLTFIINDPVIDQEGRHKAERAYQSLAADYPTDMLARLQAQGENRSLESVVAEMLGEE
jgi:predicted ATPase